MRNGLSSQRSKAFGAVALAAIAFSVAGGSNEVAKGNSLLLGAVRVGNSGAPFGGDRTLLTTISPNADGLRDTAHVWFRLAKPARVRLEVLESMNRANAPRLLEAHSSVPFGPGKHQLTWTPASKTAPRTYQLRLVVNGATLANAVVRVLGVDAGFTRPSYRPGSYATLAISTDARLLTLRFFRAGPEGGPSLYSAYRNDELHGVPAGDEMSLDWTHHRSHRSVLRLRVPSGPSGLYYARLESHDGRLGFAPFVLRPSTLGQHRVAVVFPTNTWEAYNHRDVDGDGWGDTWYEVNSINTVDLTRPYLHRGVPTRFRGYQAGFLRWIYRSGKDVDFISDDELQHVSGATLAKRYNLLVFLGHHEYMTTRAYDVVSRFRDLGGNLFFTSTTNFLYRVQRRGWRMIRTSPWRELGRPEAGLIGVQYLHNDGGKHQGKYEVVGAEQAPWAFAGTGLHNGSVFGHGGIEIDARAPSSPRGTIVLATMRNLHGAGLSPEMTYYETRAGAKVLAAGTLNFAGTALEPGVSAVLENLWSRLSRP